MATEEYLCLVCLQLLPSGMVNYDRLESLLKLGKSIQFAIPELQMLQEYLSLCGRFAAAGHFDKRMACCLIGMGVDPSSLFLQGKHY